jgi:hypothetical protein
MVVVTRRTLKTFNDNLVAHLDVVKDISLYCRFSNVLFFQPINKTVDAFGECWGHPDKMKKKTEFNDGTTWRRGRCHNAVKTGSLIVLVSHFTTSAGNSSFEERRYIPPKSGHYVLSPENSDKNERRKERNGRPYCVARESFVVLQSSTPSRCISRLASPSLVEGGILLFTKKKK